MKRFLTTALLCLLALGLAGQDAEAKRLGGGASRGLQRDNVTQRQATPQPYPPAQQASPQAPSAPIPTPTTPPRRSWLGPLAGLAAGIGLGALLSHFGLGEGMADLMIILLLAAAAVFVFRLLFRRPAPAAHEPLHYAGVGGPHMAPPPSTPPAVATAMGGEGERGAAPPPAPNVPPGFDADAFLRVAKVNFVRLQAANDAGNLDDIRQFTTPEMFAEIKVDIDERRGAVQHTDVVTLEAELLEVVTEADRHIASVRYHGMIREEEGAPGHSFDEVWHLVKPAAGSGGWVIAGIQQLG